MHSFFIPVKQVAQQIHSYSWKMQTRQANARFCTYIYFKTTGYWNIKVLWSGKCFQGSNLRIVFTARAMSLHDNKLAVIYK